MLSRLAVRDTCPASTTDGATRPTLRSIRPSYSKLIPVDPAHYTDRAELCRGGMGRIVVARDRRLDRTVVIKELRCDSPELRARFEREALLTARLQHPAIVGIYEAGRWPSGEPFFAMEHVDGRSLHDVIAATESFDQRLALVPHVLAVADALAYAHRDRIIHRDLKPQNVMLGSFGETVVIDWGLAKDLRTAIDEPCTPVPDTGGTVAGEVLGTPAYMPPEQALGEGVDERADVYAIGAMLYHVLASVTPYEEDSGLAVLDAVVSRAPVSLEAREPGVPLDLLAIVERAMARDPAMRYPSARELADDLRRFLSGQLVGAHRYSRRQLLRRWLARHRSVLAVAGIGLAIVAIVAAASVHRVIAARALADQRRADAEELMGFMLGDLRDRLDPLGQVALLDTVAEKARAYYREAPTGSPSDEHLRGLSHASVGDVLVARGDTDGAIAAYRESLQVLDRIPTFDPRYRRDLARVHEKLAGSLLDAGDLEEARAHYRNELEIVAALIAIDPTPETRERVIEAHRGIGMTLVELGDLAGARAEYERSLAIAETNLAVAGSRPSALRAIALARNALGDVLEQQGDLPGALREFRASLAVVDDLSAREPGNTQWLEDRAVNRNQIGGLLQRLDRPAAALVELRSGLALREQLVARDPAHVAWQRGVFAGHLQIGKALLAQHDPTAALASFRSALAIATRLATRDPSNADWQRNLGVIHDKIGRASLALDDIPEAIASHGRALAIFERLAADSPESTTAQNDAATAHLLRGTARQASGDHGGARADLTIARRIVSGLLAKHPGLAATRELAREIEDRLANDTAP